ncbi:nuclear transport factor 2 family protein [Acerihabitans sp. TG2]|uniref:nuclear transport factor 2 family protein n=1 Tax=Acerihabitans sp. TG2 TaxID=3096008 RepID=UPI002B224B0E|nr:nuclear transport factor 2 family protein [Acerihabitans sp. TG2]MEA9390408.1 nuclear transport factor 2 family protein [Acerihabitans sp. TG2]
MKNQIDKKIAEDFLAAYAAHDFQRIALLLHNDIEWNLPGNGPISGTAVGIDAVIRRVKTIIASGIKTELHHILIGQHGITLSLHNTASKPDGRQLDEELATVLAVDAGLIKRIDTYLSDVPIMERFFNA